MIILKEQTDYSSYYRHDKLESVLKRLTRRKERMLAAGLALTVVALIGAVILSWAGAVKLTLWLGLGAFAVLIVTVIILLPSFWPRCSLCGALLSQVERAGGGSRPILVCCHACQIYADSGELDGD
jgi:Na+(H+)/acetate symporter ActP